VAPPLIALKGAVAPAPRFCSGPDDEETTDVVVVVPLVEICNGVAASSSDSTIAILSATVTISIFSAPIAILTSATIFILSAPIATLTSAPDSGGSFFALLVEWAGDDG